MSTFQPSIVPFLNWPVQLLCSQINICHMLCNYIYNSGYANASEYLVICTLHVLLDNVTNFLHLQNTRPWLCHSSSSSPPSSPPPPSPSPSSSPSYSPSSSSSSSDSTTLGGSWSVQQFNSTPVYPRPLPSNQQFSSSLGLLLPGPSTLTWVTLLVLFYMASNPLFFW